MLAVNLLIAGLLVGFTYALVGIAITLLVGVLGVIDLSQGAWVLLAMYLGYGLSGALGVRNSYLYYLVALGICIALYPVGTVMYRLVIGPVRVLGQQRWRREAREMVVTLAVSFIIGAIILIIWSANALSLSVGGRLSIGPITFSATYYVAGGAALVLAVALAGLIRRSHLGTQVRAVTQDELAAELFGVDCEQVRRKAYGIALSVSGAAGLLIAPTVPLSSDGALPYLLIGVSVMAVGSIGSVVGALIGGLLIGAVTSVALVWLQADLQSALIFGIIYVALIVRALRSRRFRVWRPRGRRQQVAEGT